MDTGHVEILASLTGCLAVGLALFGSVKREGGGRGPSHGAEEAGPDGGEGEALDRAKSRVLVNLLNDLRTPLMMIKTPLEAGSGVDPEEAGTMLDYANRIQHGLERAAKIIQMDAESQSVDETGETEMVDAVSYFVSSLRPRATRAGVQISFETELRSASVSVDWPRIELLLENVSEYALRGLGDGGHLTFYIASEDGESVVLEVRSDGDLEPIGESPEAVEGVGDPVTLGLLLGRRSLKRSKGSLDFVRHNDRASCRITIPAKDIQVIVPREEERALGEGDAGDERETTVLIVDDHSGTRAYMRYALRKQHRILEASDGKEALEIVRAEMPDLVISDIMMPVMDGNELCRAIKSDEDLNHIPVFLVTANSIKTLKTESLESGADDFLVKPFDVKEAVMRINNEIEMRKKLRSRYSREVVIKPSDITVTSEDEALLNRAREIVEENMANADFSIQDLASEMGLSSRQLQRRLRETVDQSPVEFVRSLRLQRAAQLLGGQYGNVSEVAYAVGFTSLSYFAKCFKEEYGASPSSYKDEQQD